MSQKRRKFSPEAKANAVLRLILHGESSSQICEDLKIHPNQLSDWKKQYVENASKAFEKPKSDSREKQLEKKVQKLEETLSHKNYVIAKVTEMNLDLKKNLGQD